MQSFADSLSEEDVLHNVRSAILEAFVDTTYQTNLMAGPAADALIDALIKHLFGPQLRWATLKYAQLQEAKDVAS